MTNFALARLGRAHVAILVDRSGSMAGSEDDVVAGVNQQIAKVLETATEKTLVSAGFFADKLELPLLAVEVDKVSPMTRDGYEPDGGTALYDSVARLLDVMEPEVEDPSNDPEETGLVIVFTDGEDTTSRDPGPLAERIRRLQATGRWTFSCLYAPKGRLKETAVCMGIPEGNVGSYAGAASFASASDAIGSYMEARARGIAATREFVKPIGELPAKGR